ncbi:LOW QUALITY PROTEIN: hypothetical protein NC652_030842 [Populus alba x Populus x berolinensis]|nr:LOW QUALITY PROTEIN: hypothetical protein NC652_030842 [Populus alba x Populus x berolinensis]
MFLTTFCFWILLFFPVYGYRHFLCSLVWLWLELENCTLFIKNEIEKKKQNLSLIQIITEKQGFSRQRFMMKIVSLKIQLLNSKSVRVRLHYLEFNLHSPCFMYKLYSRNLNLLVPFFDCPSIGLQDIEKVNVLYKLKIDFTVIRGNPDIFDSENYMFLETYS